MAEKKIIFERVGRAVFLQGLALPARAARKEGVLPVIQPQALSYLVNMRIERHGKIGGIDKIPDAEVDRRPFSPSIEGTCSIFSAPRLEPAFGKKNNSLFASGTYISRMRHIVFCVLPSYNVRNMPPESAVVFQDPFEHVKEQGDVIGLVEAIIKVIKGQPIARL